MQPRRRIHGSPPPDDGPTVGTCTREPPALPRCTRFVEAKSLVISTRTGIDIHVKKNQQEKKSQGVS